MAIDFPNSPTSGQVFNTGTRTWIWDGTQWRISATTATVSGTQVTDGTITTAKLANGAVTSAKLASNTVIPPSTVDAKGDIIVGTADNTVDNLAVGTDGQFLKANSATATGLEWDDIPTINNLDDVGDVTITSASSGDFLKWDGTAWVNDSIDLGTDTTGNYMSGVIAGTGVTVSHTPSEGSSATISIGQAVGTTNNPSFAGVTADSIRLGITASNEIDTVAGGLTIDSAGGTVTVDDDLTVTGNLTVSGTTTTINTETLELADNTIVLNSNETSAPTQDAGIEVERGTSTNVQLRWNETSDKWQFTNDGTNYTDLGAGGATVSASAPTGVDSGSLWFNTETGRTYVYYQTAWIEIGGSFVGARLNVSSSAPSTPLEGEMWFDSDTGQTFVYYDSVWVEVGGSSTTLASLNDIDDVDTSQASNGDTLIFNGTTWVADQQITVASVNDLTDVVIGNPAIGNVIRYNGTNWVNVTPDLVGNNITLDDLSNVAALNPVAGQVLTWSGNSWIPLDRGVGAVLSFSTSTGMSTDPGSGFVRFNSATLGSVSKILFSNTDVFGGNIEDWLLNTTITGASPLGTLYLTKTDGSVLIFELLDYSNSSNTWYEFSISYLGGGTLPFNGERVGFIYVLNGNQGTNGVNGTNGDWSTAQTINSYTARTVVSSDAGKVLQMTSSSAQTVTVNTSTGLTAGQRVDIYQSGAGQVTVSASGVTINTPLTLKLRGQHSYATLLCLASNQYVLIGDLASV